MRTFSNLGQQMVRHAAHYLIRFYQLTLSSLVGRTCRHLPTCSCYTDEAIQKHGFWAGGWIGLSRICRCGPWGTSGYDPVPDELPPQARWHMPWRYGQWRGPLKCEALEIQASDIEAVSIPSRSKSGSDQV